MFMKLLLIIEIDNTMKPKYNDKVWRLINFHSQLNEQEHTRPIWRDTAVIFIPKGSHKRPNKRK